MTETELGWTPCGLPGSFYIYKARTWWAGGRAATIRSRAGKPLSGIYSSATPAPATWHWFGRSGRGLAAVAQSWASGQRKWPWTVGGGASRRRTDAMTIPGCEGCERGRQGWGVAVYGDSQSRMSSALMGWRMARSGPCETRQGRMPMRCIRTVGTGGRGAASRQASRQTAGRVCTRRLHGRGQGGCVGCSHTQYAGASPGHPPSLVSKRPGSRDSLHAQMRGTVILPISHPSAPAGTANRDR